jgi:hypothetical protein
VQQVRRLVPAPRDDFAELNGGVLMVEHPYAEAAQAATARR